MVELGQLGLSDAHPSHCSPCPSPPLTDPSISVAPGVGPASLASQPQARGEHGQCGICLHSLNSSDKLIAIPQDPPFHQQQGTDVDGIRGVGLGIRPPAFRPALWLGGVGRAWSGGARSFSSPDSLESFSSGAQPMFVLSFWVSALWPAGG